MNRLARHRMSLAAALAAAALAQQTPASKPDPREIPLPPIATSMPAMPGVDKLPDRPTMPDALTMNDGKRVTSAAQWKQRRAEIKWTLEYYAVGQAPPPPGNVKGREVSSQLVLNGKVKYRLVHLTFWPGNESLQPQDIGIFTASRGRQCTHADFALGLPSRSRPIAQAAARREPRQGRRCAVGDRPRPHSGSSRGRRGPRRTRWIRRAAHRRIHRREQPGHRARLRVRHVQQQRLRRRHHAAQRRWQLGIPHHALLPRLPEV